MNPERIRQVIHASLKTVAPEVDPSTIAPDADLREDIDLDSMDFLNFINALHRELGVDIPEADYAQLNTLAGAEQYLTAHQSGTAS